MFTSKSLVKNSAGDALDANSGLGVVSYDNTADKLVINTKVKTDFFTFFIQGLTFLNENVLYPASVQLYTVDFNTTVIERSLVYQG